MDELCAYILEIMANFTLEMNIVLKPLLYNIYWMPYCKVFKSLCYETVTHKSQIRFTALRHKVRWSALHRFVVHCECCRNYIMIPPWCWKRKKDGKATFFWQIEYKQRIFTTTTIISSSTLAVIIALTLMFKKFQCEDFAAPPGIAFLKDQYFLACLSNV